MRGLRRRLAGAVLEPISDHPLRTAGGIGALAAAAVVWVGVTAETAGRTATTGDNGVTLTAVIEYAAAHPAYPAAILLGLAVFLFAD